MMSRLIIIVAFCEWGNQKVGYQPHKCPTQPTHKTKPPTKRPLEINQELDFSALSARPHVK